MMMGPAPMIMIVVMSVRFGMVSLNGSPDATHRKGPRERPRYVARARGGLRLVRERGKSHPVEGTP
jgi:hypothetical protein